MKVIGARDTEVGVEFQPRDLWVGIYVDSKLEPWEKWHNTFEPRERAHVWICLLPMIAIHISWWRG